MNFEQLIMFIFLVSGVMGTTDTVKDMTCGKILEDGVCLVEDYHRDKVPEKGKTRIIVTFIDQIVRSLNSKRNTIEIDFNFALRWRDPGISSNFSDQDIKNGGIGLDLKSDFWEIWKPDLYIYDLKDYKVIWSDQIRLASLKVLSHNTSNIQDKWIEWKMEANVQIFCALDLHYYPMDNQTCRFRMGSQSPNYKFILDEQKVNYHKPYQTENDDYFLNVSFFQEDVSPNENDRNSLGFKIKIKRKIKSYLLRYYLTSAAIVFTSQISFIISIDALPGRIGLIVGLFLTLTNIFIHQMADNPSGAELNVLQMYLIVSLIFVVGTIVQFALVLLWKNNETIISEVAKSLRKGKSNSKDLKMPQFRVSTNTLDAISFIIFFTSYSLFNLVYWTYCIFH